MLAPALILTTPMWQQHIDVRLVNLDSTPLLRLRLVLSPSADDPLFPRRLVICRSFYLSLLLSLTLSALPLSQRLSDLPCCLLCGLTLLYSLELGRLQRCHLLPNPIQTHVSSPRLEVAPLHLHNVVGSVWF